MKRRRRKLHKNPGSGPSSLPSVSLRGMIDAVKQVACGAIAGVRLQDSFDKSGTRWISVYLTIQGQEVEVIRTVDAGGDDKICSIDHWVKLPEAVFGEKS